MQEAFHIPDDLGACQQMLRELREAHARLEQVCEELRRTNSTLEATRQKLEQERQELSLSVKELMNRIYGRRSERFTSSPEQRTLDFGDQTPLEVVVAPEPENEPEDVTPTAPQRKSRRNKNKGKGKGKFPDHLERRVERIEPTLPEGVRLDDCDLIGVDVVEILEFERPRVWVRVLEYPKYKIPSQPELQIVQGPREVSLVEGGNFGFGMAAEVVFSKFSQHVPLYRKQDCLAQLGWSPNRSTLCNIVCYAALLLQPLAERIRQLILKTHVINTDDTIVTLLTPGESPGSRTARFWVYHGRDEAHYDAFAFTDSRERAGPDEYLKRYGGTLCGDCYSGYVNIETVTNGRIVFSACNSHARRYVFQGRESHLAWSTQVLTLYAELYGIEERARHFTATERFWLRVRESVPLMAKLRALIDHPETDKILPKSRLGKAIRYIRGNWNALSHFLSDGNVPIDNNDAERELRRVALGRKNWLFVGSEQGGERTSIILTIMSSAHRHDLDEWAYLRDVLEKLARGDTDLDDLLPDNWKKKNPDKVRTFRAEERERRAQVRSIARVKRRDAKKATATTQATNA